MGALFAAAQVLACGIRRRMSAYVIHTSAYVGMRNTYGSICQHTSACGNTSVRLAAAQVLADSAVCVWCMCPHAAICVSAYCFICVLIMLYIETLVALQPASLCCAQALAGLLCICTHTATNVSAYCYICVLIMLYMCPHNATNMYAYCCV